MCNAPKFGEIEERTGYGGGYNDRGVVEYKERRDEDDEYDEFGRRKKKRKLEKNSDDDSKDSKYSSPSRSKSRDKEERDEVKEEEREENVKSLCLKVAWIEKCDVTLFNSIDWNTSRILNRYRKSQEEEEDDEEEEEEDGDLSKYDLSEWDDFAPAKKR